MLPMTGTLMLKLIDDTAGSNAHCFALSDYTPGKAMAPASRAHFRNGKKTGLSLKNIYYTCCERLMVHLQQREVNIDEAKLTLQGLMQHYVYPW